MQVGVSSLIGLFCLIGCLYQIYDVTKFYLQFKVRRDVAYDYSASIELPAIDIMVPMAMALNHSKFFAPYPERLQSICARLKERYKKLNYTIDYSRGNCDDAISLKILESDPVAYSFNYTSGVRVGDIHLTVFDLEHQFKEIFIPYFTVLNHKHCNTERYYNGLAIFMRIYCLNGTKPFSIEKTIASRRLGYTHTLEHSFGLYFGIRLSDPTDLPIFERSKYFMITREPGLFPQVVISFVKTVMSSLEYPYETNCRHYNKGKSISKCMTEYTLGRSPPYLFRNSVQKFGEHPFPLGFREDNKGDDINKHGFSKKVSQGELDAFINCKQQAAATECEKTNYLLEGKVLNDKIPKDYGLIWFKPSWQANVYLSVHPVLPWDEYIIFIGSIIGLWFGISMYDNAFKIFLIIKSKFLILKNKQNNEKNIKCITTAQSRKEECQNE